MEFPNFVGPSGEVFSSKIQCSRTLNLIIEKIGTGEEEGQAIFYRRHGLTHKYTASGGCRGAIELNEHAFFVFGAQVYDMTGPATLNIAYPLAKSDDRPVSMAIDQQSCGIVSKGTLYMINSAAITAPVTPCTPIAVAKINNYWVLLSDDLSQFFFSDDGLAWDPLDVQTAEASANLLQAMIVDHQELRLCGSQVTQVFYVGSNPDAPFVPRTDAVIPFGIEAQFSLQTLGDSCYWLGRSKEGRGTLVRTRGYSPQDISSTAFANAVRGYLRDFGTIADAIGWAYQINKHNYYQITFPAANASWLYDETNDQLVEIPWWNTPLGQYERHRVTFGLSAFGKILGGDRSNGKIYEVSPDIYDDDGEPIRVDRIAPHLVKENYEVQYSRFEILAQAGNGRPRADWVRMAAPGAPVLAAAAGAIAAGTYYVRLTLWNNLGETYPSGSTSIALGAPGGITVTAPATVEYARGYRIYAESLDGSEKLQASVTGFGDTTLAALTSDPTATSPEYPTNDPDPQIIGLWSDDGGNTWTNEKTRSMGRAGEYKKRMYWANCGSGQDRAWRIIQTDPVKLAIRGACFEAEVCDE